MAKFNVTVEAQLHPNKGWSLTRIDIDNEGAELDRGLLRDGFFPSIEVARHFFDTDARLQYLRDKGVNLRFEKCAT